MLYAGCLFALAVVFALVVLAWGCDTLQKQIDALHRGKCSAIRADALDGKLGRLRDQHSDQLRHLGDDLHHLRERLDALEEHPGLNRILDRIHDRLNQLGRSRPTREEIHARIVGDRNALLRSLAERFTRTADGSEPGAAHEPMTFDGGLPCGEG